MAYSSVERIRHAPLGRSRTPRRPEWAQGVPRAYRGRGPRALHSIYDADHDDARSSGRFRWLVSTCLAAAVGALAIGVVIFGSLDTKEGREAFLPTLKGFGEGHLPSQPLLPEARPADGLHWTVAKSDRLPVAGEAATAKYLIHEQVQIKRNNRPFL